jgi:hypothetical protein
VYFELLATFVKLRKATFYLCSVCLKGKNQCVRKKIGVQNIVKEIKQYQLKWLQHAQRMDTNRIPKQALLYRPKERRNIGRPRNR